MMILMAYGLKAVLMIINKHSNPMPKVQIARRLETSSKWEKIQCGSPKSFILCRYPDEEWSPLAYGFWAYLDLNTSALGWMRDLFELTCQDVKWNY